MNFGYIKTAVCTPKIKVADCQYNAQQIINAINEAHECNVKLLVFPALCVTGSTCADLFYQKTLLSGAENALIEIAKATKDSDMLVFVGAPISISDSIYNCAVAIKDGEVIAIIPKDGVDKKQNQFKGFDGYTTYPINGEDVVVESEIIFRDINNPDVTIAVEIGSSLDNALSVSTYHAMAGAKIIVNLSAIPTLVGENKYREQVVAVTSAKNKCAYVYANAGDGESTTDLLYAGGNFIAENGKILAKSEPFTTGLTITDIDCSFLSSERIKSGFAIDNEDYSTMEVEFGITDKLDRKYSPSPFIPEKDEEDERADFILNMQAHALKKRIEHTNTKSLVIGVSGGLDSSLALLVAVKAMKLLVALL